MIQILDSSISINSLIWLFLVAFMLHDFEEIIRMEPWYRKYSKTIFSRVPEKFHKDLQSLSKMTSSQFTFAVCIEFIIFVPFTFFATEKVYYLTNVRKNSPILKEREG